MDAKDLRTEPALSERSNDASKYAQSGTALQNNRNKSYQDIGSNSSAKVEAATVRPCAVIGPDRVVPPSDHNDAYLKKASVEPWPCSDIPYHRPPEYPHKTAAYHNPTRNISPRQTFQENMQRIMVPPTYNSVKVNDDASFIQKLNVTSDAKYCDVPYSVNPITNDPKNIRSVEMCLPNVNPALGRSAPHGWAPGGINVRPQRPYGPSEMYQFPEYPSCAGPRPVSISRPHRNIPEESAYMYPETYYQESNIRFKPYPNVKERYPQQRYDYITNYSNPFHPPCPPQKYEIPKSLPPHPYSGYPHFKYLDSRMPEPLLEGYQRQGQQGYNMPYRNQIVHPAYGPMMSNNSQSKIPPYQPDGSIKSVTSNKLPYDSNGKIYVEYDNARTKCFPSSETFYPSEMTRHHAIPKGAMPNYPSINMQSIPPNSYYKRDNPQMKNYEYVNHLKNLNQSININSLVQRHIPQFSPNTIAISPTDSNTSNDTSHTHGTSQEDCGYVSQSSTTSIRSIEIGHVKIPNDYYGRYYDPKYGQVIRAGPTITKLNRNSSSVDGKDKKDMDVRKFLQMWNEGDDDNTEISSNKEIIVQGNSNELSSISKQHGINNQEQLYVLGLVNVPSEELSKYEHIQKVSKLPENIKGYNSIELLNQFEEVIESSNINNYKLSTPKEYQTTNKVCTPKQVIGLLPRPISPLDVEAKISQSVIHKEVGCNFEIKPCSPKMLNVEIAAPVQNILNERVIEKVTNPLSMITSPMLNGMEDNDEISSCKMLNTPFSNPDPNSIKTNYSIQDLESNAGVCLASLPRLDNDIELNFPEVNQQFINANKGEAAMSTHIKDSSKLSVIDQTDKILRDIKPDSLSNELSPKVEIEREFTKLSKYRKTKINISDNRQDKLAIKAIRTDSVIIKNPENTKSLEACKEKSINKMEMNQQIALKLTSQVDLAVDTVSDPNVQNEMNSNDSLHSASEEAIDFRLNKDSIDHFGINDSITKVCESLQLPTNEDKLADSNLCDNTNEITKKLEEDENLKIEHADVACTEKDTENESLDNRISFESTPYESYQKIDNLCVSDVVKKFDQSADLPNLNLEHSPEINTKCLNSNENKILELELCNENINKTIELGIIDKDSILEPQVETKTCIQMDINRKSYNIETTKKDFCSHENRNIQEEHTEKKLQSESTTILLTAQINDGSKCEDNMDISSETIQQPRETQDFPLQTDNTELRDFKPSTEMADMSNNDEGFISIDEKHNCNQEIESNYLSGNDIYQSDKNMTVKKAIELKRNFNKRFGYGSKKLYSPWIQKLLMFNEGFCCTLSPDKIKTSPIPTGNSLVVQLENIASDNCSKIYCISDISINDDSLYSKDDTPIDTNEIISSSACDQLKIHARNKDDADYVQNSPLAIDKPDEERCDTEGISVNIAENDKIEEMFHVKQDLNLCIDMESEKSTKQSKNDTIIENLPDELNADVYTDITPEKITEKTKENTIKEVLCDEHDVSTNTDVVSIPISTNSKDDTIKDILSDEPNDKPCIDTKFEGNLYDKSNETSPSKELGNSKQLKDTLEECTKKIDEIACTVNLSASKQMKTKHRVSLKRSLSDSALNILHSEREREEISVVWPFKRSKLDTETIDESDIIAQNLCNILQNNRRNSISAVYNEENVSFCILIEDNTIITEENDDADKICYTELSEDCLNEINNTYGCEENHVDETIVDVPCDEEKGCEYSDSVTLNSTTDISPHRTWVEDVACVETVVSDDIAEDIVISSASTPKGIHFWDSEYLNYYENNDKDDDAVITSPTYHDGIGHSDPQFHELCESPHTEDNETIILNETQNFETSHELYDNESLEKILSDSNSHAEPPYDETSRVFSTECLKIKEAPENKENMIVDIISESANNGKCSSAVNEIENKIAQDRISFKMCEKMQDGTVHSCESSIDNVFSYKYRDDSANYATSNSPEVSSTTSEEKTSGILLKITNYKGSKVSKINKFNPNTNNRISCKLTEKNNYVNSSAKHNPNRTLITKAAKKYIPPIKESIRDLKVKLSLPPHSLLKLKEMKTSKDEPKLNKQSSPPTRLPKKPKPKFEDVLKSIDEIQIKMHKEKNKRVRKSIPKVVIKKNENGSHYASTSNKDAFNPDLTGRKWQPWVFLEKNNFIDKMATRRKTKAIFSHRKNAYVLAEKFHKYKSASSTKFIISQPKLSDSTTGQLKYTIRLKHTY